MDVFICNKCQEVHKYDDLSITSVCDACKQPLAGHKYECAICMYSNDQDEENARYHKTCVVKLENAWYCATHRVKKEKAIEATTIIQKYAEDFWKELGGVIKEFRKSYQKGSFKVDFDVLTLSVNLTAVSKVGDVENEEDLNNEIIALKHEVSGIKSYGSATYQVGIHSHQDALEQVAGALVRSLRSKKSALTSERNLIKSEYSGLTTQEQKDYYGTVKKCLARERSRLSELGKRRAKINKLSDKLVAKLDEIKKVKLEPVLV